MNTKKVNTKKIKHQKLKYFLLKGVKEVVANSQSGFLLSTKTILIEKPDNTFPDWEIEPRITQQTLKPTEQLAAFTWHTNCVSKYLINVKVPTVYNNTRPCEYALIYDNYKKNA